MINSSRASVLNIDFLSDSDEQQTKQQKNINSSIQITEEKSNILPKYFPNIVSSTIVKHVFSNQAYQIFDQYQIHPSVKQKMKKQAQNEQKNIKNEKSNKMQILQQKQHDNDDETKSNEQDKKVKNKINSNIFIHSEQEDEKQQNNGQEQQNLITNTLTHRNIKKIQFQESSEEQSDHHAQNSSSQDELNNKTTQKQQMNNFNYGSQYLLAFCYTQVQANKVLKLTIIRDSSGFNMLWPNYSVFFCNMGQNLMTAKKMKGSISSNYYIATDLNIQSVEHPGFLAKLRANFNESVYNVYSKGVKQMQSNSSNKKIRQIIATVKFLPVIADKRPRLSQIFILKQKVRYLDLHGAILGKQVGLDVLYKLQDNKCQIHYFKNRQPTFSQQLNGFTLNFKGRANMASVKNIIFENVQTQQQVLVIGKIKQNEFRMDVSHPMRPDISLCIALANFDSKFTSY